MARIFKNTEQCKLLIEKLSVIFPYYGSIRKLVSHLNTFLVNTQLREILSQRVQNLLDSDPNKSISKDTFASLSYAVEMAGDHEIDKNFQKKLNDIFSIEVELNDDPKVAINNISKNEVIPFLVVDHYVNLSTGNKIRPSNQQEPDWSWQDKVVSNVIKDLKHQVGKYGVIIPTGGGKTRVANRIIIDWISQNSGKVLWITHRSMLLEQAENGLVKLMDVLGVDRQKQAEIRSRFIYQSNLSYVQNFNLNDLSLIIIDEAHHAAAETYTAAINQNKASVLMLTATPNRADGKEIGIQKISFQISYKELFKKRCIIEPIFEKPFYINENNNYPSSKNYNDEDLCRELAKYVLKRTNTDLKKCLICVTHKTYAENIHNALLDEYNQNICHDRLDLDQIHFIHGDKNSLSKSTNDFLKINCQESSGILVATSSLIGEGFDDPFIDSVFITYPSQSITQLMQMGGRALRHSPGKKEARIIQVHQSRLAYHFNNRWLYQDISDNLRPRLIDITFTSKIDRKNKLLKLLEQHNVSQDNLSKVTNLVEGLPLNENFRINLSGLDYFGNKDDFSDKGKFTAFFVNNEEHHRFKVIFNDVSFHDELSQVYDPPKYLKLMNVPLDDDLFSDYMTLIYSLNKARNEINNTIDVIDARNYFETASEGNTWIKYINFYYEEQNKELELFLEDCVNKDDILSEYLNSQFYVALKVYYPVHSAKAFLLDEVQYGQFLNLKNEILNTIRGNDLEQIEIMERIKNSQTSVSYPTMIFNNIQQFLNDRIYTNNSLILNEK